MDAATLTSLIAAVTQLAMGAAAYRLATRIGERLEETDKRVDGHETRLMVLETVH